MHLCWFFCRFCWFFCRFTRSAASEWRFHRPQPVAAHAPSHRSPSTCTLISTATQFLSFANSLSLILSAAGGSIPTPPGHSYRNFSSLPPIWPRELLPTDSIMKEDRFGQFLARTPNVRAIAPQLLTNLPQFDPSISYPATYVCQSNFETSKFFPITNTKTFTHQSFTLFSKTSEQNYTLFIANLLCLNLIPASIPQ